MITIPVICLGVLCFLMAIVYTIYGQKGGWQGLLVRGLAILSCIGLVQVCASLKSLTNVLPIFVTIGLAILLLGEAIKVVGVASDKAQNVTTGILNSLGFISISLGGLTLSEFSLFALLGSIFFGVAFGFILCAIKKYKTKEKIFMEILSFTSIGFILGFGLMAVVSSSHTFSAYCMLGGGLILLFQKFMLALGKGGKAISYIGNALYILALTAISFSIYLY